jgi:hypothetical protein
VSRGFETLHDPLASSGWLVRIPRPIVEAFVVTMFDTGHDLALCRYIGAEFISDHNARRLSGLKSRLQVFEKEAPEQLFITLFQDKLIHHKLTFITG